MHAWNGLKERTQHQQSIETRDVLTVTSVASHSERNKKEQILEFLDCRYLAKEVKWIKRDSEGRWITTYNQYLQDLTARILQ